MSYAAAKYTEFRCKICRSPHRADIDQLLLRRSERRKTDEGGTCNSDYVRAKCLEWGVPNPTLDNLGIHWRKHCEIVQDKVAIKSIENLNTALALLQDRILDRPLGPDTLTDDLIEITQASLREQVANGQIPRVTIDQALKAIDTKTRRKQNEKVTELLELQAEALTQSLGHYDAEEAEIVDDEAETAKV